MKNVINIGYDSKQWHENEVNKIQSKIEFNYMGEVAKMRSGEVLIVDDIPFVLQNIIRNTDKKMNLYSFLLAKERSIIN